MNFFADFITPFKKGSRITRGEYWLFQIKFWFITAILMLPLTINILLSNTSNVSGLNSQLLGILMIAYTIAFLIKFFVQIPLIIRRLHDVGRSGWWYLIGFTIIGLIPLLHWSLKPSQQQENKYGPCRDNSIKTIWSEFKIGIKQLTIYSGTMTREEYGLFYSGMSFIIFILAMISVPFTASANQDFWGLTIANLPFTVLSIILNSAALSRRLHDVGKSGWWQVPVYIPGLNILFGYVVYYWVLQPSKQA